MGTPRSRLGDAFVERTPPSPPGAIEYAQSLRYCGAWVCADTTLTPRPPLPPAGEGEKRALARKGAMGYGLNDFHDRFAMVDLEAFATGYLKLA